MSDIFSNFPLGVQLWPQAKRRSQHLQEGYSFSLLENSSDTYHFSILARPEKVQAAFKDFACSIPGEAFFILEFYTTIAEVMVGSLESIVDLDERRRLIVRCQSMLGSANVPLAG